MPAFSRAHVLIAGFLVIAVVLAGVLLTRSHGGAAEAPPSSPVVGSGSPNIILILTDDQRWDTLWAMPKTRHLLADRGVQFTNSFVVNSLCCPSRASILTGQYSHSNGVYTNFPPLGGYHAFDPTTTIATVLQERGYQTALMGKYLNGYTTTKVPPGWDTWDAFNGAHGGVSYFNYPMIQNGTEVQYGANPADYSTDVLAGLATKYIADTNSPFFLYFAPSAPHMPAVTAPRDAHAFPNLRPFRPPAFDEKDTSDKPPWLRAIPPFNAARVAKEDRIYGAQTRSLPPVDDAVQRIVDTLKATGKLHNTLILFMSDNGYMHGEHRLGGKQSPYEESIRVPMILRYDPLTAGGVVRKDPRMALNIDLASTFADAAGTTMPDADGTSLLDLIRHPAMPGRHWFLIEHVELPAEAPFPEDNEQGPPVPTFCAVRSRRWKYVYYADGSQELYDLKVDPHELRNLIGVPSADHALQAADVELHKLCVPAPPGLTLP